MQVKTLAIRRRCRPFCPCPNGLGALRACKSRYGVDLRQVTRLEQHHGFRHTSTFGRLDWRGRHGAAHRAVEVGPVRYLGRRTMRAAYYDGFGARAHVHGAAQHARDDRPERSLEWDTRDGEGRRRVVHVDAPSLDGRPGPHETLTDRTGAGLVALCLVVAWYGLQRRRRKALARPHRHRS